MNSKINIIIFVVPTKKSFKASVHMKSNYWDRIFDQSKVGKNH